VARHATSHNLDVKLCVKLHLRDERTDGRTTVCLFVRCVCQGRPSYWGERTAMLDRNLRREAKIRDQPINTWTFVRWLSGKSSQNYCHQVSHCKAKMRQILFPASVRSFVRSSLRWSLTLWRRRAHVPRTRPISHRRRDTHLANTFFSAEERERW